MPRRPATAAPTALPAPGIDAAAMRSHAGEAAQLLRALANDSRLLVLCMLAEGERSVGELNEGLELSQSALSQHLAVLRRDGLVTTRRSGQAVLYSLADGPARRVVATLHEIYCGKRS
ncbi:winged helix-turn-helix transcriptional regulator [Luteimonas sp. SJ-92]|uniref:Winged helix-turn-helix transcriptional regulator n=1 Tax=Luteimonas salinisoli TaxID=2752307 RepID=A0A853JGI2_9GAMM|nr:metalloregulator ArsR/SmtB family transcription factor [Luteimonas salinisoli]NZA27854.1 winged helix-turn-helix transcriptional regulator [Luteimonas salinisoli]